MAIEMIGAIYFPLSSRDPKNRLHMLLEQTQARLVLVHYLTKAKFNYTTTLLDIDSILINNNPISVDVDRLSNVKVTLNSIAYIIFTSGSTGMPKGVSIGTTRVAENKYFK
jgi:non-ribosomal peptide synthetase component F